MLIRLLSGHETLRSINDMRFVKSCKLSGKSRYIVHRIAIILAAR